MPSHSASCLTEVCIAWHEPTRHQRWLSPAARSSWSATHPTSASRSIEVCVVWRMPTCHRWWRPVLAAGGDSCTSRGQPRMPNPECCKFLDLSPQRKKIQRGCLQGYWHTLSWTTLPLNGCKQTTPMQSHPMHEAMSFVFMSTGSSAAAAATYPDPFFVLLNQQLC